MKGRKMWQKMRNFAPYIIYNIGEESVDTNRI